MKKLCTILTVLVLTVLCIALLPTDAQAAEVTAGGNCGENLTWTLDSEGTLTISGEGEMDDYYYEHVYTDEFPHHCLNVPAPWHGYLEDIKKIVIEPGVTSVGNFAFHDYELHSEGGGVVEYASCINLEAVVVPHSVTNIGDYAFLYCYNITTVSYCGTRAEWSQIEIGEGNDCLVKDSLLEFHEVQLSVIEPTYTKTGKVRRVCVDCGEVEEAIPAKFYGTSVNLGNTLDMYFGFYTGLVDEKGTVKFVREGEYGFTETTEKPITTFKKNNSVYDITYTGLAAKEMTDTVHVYVYNGDGVLVGQHSDSIRSYILRQLREKEYGVEFRKLCVDLLNYGAAAQIAFDYHGYGLANEGLTEEELAEGTQTVAEYSNKQIITGEITSYYGTAYILEEKISMKLAVRAEHFDAGCYALVSYTDHAGNERADVRLAGKLNNDVYEFVFNEMVVADGRCLLTVAFYKADGTKVLTVQDSMESYTARKATEYPLAEKMLAFSDSAYRYLHS